jgi:hypothetical protein
MASSLSQLKGVQYIMRHSLCLAVVFTSCVAVSTLAAQNQPTPYARSLCIKVQPGKDAEWRKLVSDVSKPTAQVRADAGEFSTRLLLRAVFPAGLDAACDYNLVYLYPGFPPDPKTAMSADSAHEKAHVAMSQSDFAAKRDSLTRLRRTELWSIIDGIGTPELGNYLRLDYMKVQPGQGAEWVKAERETHKPLHQARVDLGALKGWTLTRLVMPSGSAQPYNAMTVNMFKDWAQIGGPAKYQEAFKKVYPGKDASEINAQTAKLRDIVRTELYEVVDVTRPTHSTTTSAQR